MIFRLGKKTYHFINQREHLRQPTIYLIVGGISALTDLILLFIFVDIFHIFYILAAIISFIFVSSAAFFFHRAFTFKFSGGKDKLRYFLFLFTAATGLFWSVTLLFSLVEFLHLWYLFAAVLTKFLVLIWNFLINKFVTFRKVKSYSTN